MKKYDSYKDSGIDWIGEIPKHWEVSSVKFLSKIQNGSTPSSSVEEYWNGDVNWVTTDDLGKLKRKEITKTKRTISQLGYESCGTTVAPIGSIVISTRAPIGHIGILKIEACSNQGCKTIIPTKINSNFCYYYFLKSKEILESLGQGSTFKELPTPTLKDFKVVFPNLDEQNLISNYLDHKTTQIDNLISKKQQFINLLQEERIAVINQAVTKGLDSNVKMKDSGIEWLGEIPKHWEVKKLKYICKLITKKATDKPDYVLALENIKSWSGEIIGNPYENKMEGDAILFEENDVLFSKLRPYLSKVSKTIRNGGCVGELLVLRAEKTVSPDFLYQRLSSEMIITIVDGSTYGTKMPRASWDKFISDLCVGLPPIKEQIEIANYLNNKIFEIGIVISKSQQEIELLNEYKTALISEVVTGKVDVREEVLN